MYYIFRDIIQPLINKTPAPVAQWLTWQNEIQWTGRKVVVPLRERPAPISLFRSLSDGNYPGRGCLLREKPMCLSQGQGIPGRLLTVSIWSVWSI